MFIRLSVQQVKDKLTNLGFKRTKSKQFIRYEKGNKGVELLTYHNLTELDCYLIVNNDYNENNMNELKRELEEAFKGFIEA